MRQNETNYKRQVQTVISDVFRRMLKHEKTKIRTGGKPRVKQQGSTAVYRSLGVYMEFRVAT